MPRRFVYLSAGLALVLLIGGAIQTPLRLVFPFWIAVVSPFIMRANRLSEEEGS